jgi:hypothetical protein
MIILIMNITLFRDVLPCILLDIYELTCAESLCLNFEVAED